MTPAQPPLPTAWNLPFQPLPGSQTSTLISESLEGVSVADTRQNSGRFWYGLAPAPDRSPGVENVPAGTSCAAVMVVSFKASFARLSQGAANAGTADSHASIRTAQVIVDVFIAPPTDKKGSPEGLPFLVPRTLAPKRRLRGLLQAGQQRLDHLRVLLVGGRVRLRVVVRCNLRLLPVAIEVERLAADVGGVVDGPVLLRPQSVRAEIGDEDLRLRQRGAVQLDVEVAVVLHVEQRICPPWRIEFRADDEQLAAREIQGAHILVRRSTLHGKAIELHRVEQLDEFSDGSRRLGILGRGRRGQEQNCGEGDTTQSTNRARHVPPW